MRTTNKFLKDKKTEHQGGPIMVVIKSDGDWSRIYERETHYARIYPISKTPNKLYSILWNICSEEKFRYMAGKFRRTDMKKVNVLFKIIFSESYHRQCLVMMLIWHFQIKIWIYMCENCTFVIIVTVVFYAIYRQVFFLFSVSFAY